MAASRAEAKSRNINPHKLITPTEMVFQFFPLANAFLAIATQEKMAEKASERDWRAELIVL